MLTNLINWITSRRQPPVVITLAPDLPPTHNTRFPVRPIPQPEAIPDHTLYEAVPHHGFWAITQGDLVRWPGLSEAEARAMARTLNSEARLQARLAVARNGSGA